MNWKEFFKLNFDLKKDLITVFLGIIAFSFGINWCVMSCSGPFIWSPPPKECFALYCQVLFNPILWGFGSIFRLPQNCYPPIITSIIQKSVVGKCYFPDSSFLITLGMTQITLGVIYWYTLSCLIVWIYNKLRKK